MTKPAPQVYSKAYIPSNPKSRSPASEGPGARQSEGNPLLSQDDGKHRAEIKPRRSGGKVARTR
jgi:hypothetical protein